jgi:hypothetical protein
MSVEESAVAASVPLAGRSHWRGWIFPALFVAAATGTVLLMVAGQREQPAGLSSLYGMALAIFTFGLVLGRVFAARAHALVVLLLFYLAGSAVMQALTWHLAQSILIRKRTWFEVWQEVTLTPRVGPAFEVSPFEMLPSIAGMTAEAVAIGFGGILIGHYLRPRVNRMRVGQRRAGPRMLPEQAPLSG